MKHSILPLRLLSGFTIMFFAFSVLNGQETQLTPPPAPAGSDAEDSVPQKKTLTGIRFVFQELPTGFDGELHMPVNKKESVKVPLLKGVVGDRVPFPEKGVIEFYDQPVEEGQKLAGRKLLSSKLPSRISERMIGVIVPSETGWNIFYLDEKELKVSTVILKNLTSLPVQIQIGPETYLTLKPGEEHLFSPGLNTGKSNVHSAKLYNRDEKGEWYVSRQFSLQIRKKHAELNLFVWNHHLQRPDLQKIVIAPEYVFKPKKVSGKQPPVRVKYPGGN